VEKYCPGVLEVHTTSQFCPFHATLGSDWAKAPVATGMGTMSIVWPAPSTRAAYTSVICVPNP
jgi:hypothetical protein